MSPTEYSPTAGFEEYDNYPADAASADTPSKPIPFGAIGSMLSNIGRALDAGTPPPPKGGLPFGNQMSLPTPRSQAISNQVAPGQLDPLGITPPMQRPGDQAIQALARLYPGFSL